MLSVGDLLLKSNPGAYPRSWFGYQSGRCFSQAFTPGGAPSSATTALSQARLEPFKRCLSNDLERERIAKEMEALRGGEIQSFLQDSLLGKFIRVFMRPVKEYLRVMELCSKDPEYKHVAVCLKILGRAFKYVLWACVVYLGAVATEVLDEFRKKFTDAGKDRAAIISEIKSGNKFIVDQINEVKALLSSLIQHTEKAEVKERAIRKLEDELVILKAHLGSPRLQLFENVKALENLMSELAKEVTKYKQDYETNVHQLNDNLKIKEKLIAELEEEVSKLKEEHKCYIQKVAQELRDKERNISELKSKLDRP